MYRGTLSSTLDNTFRYKIRTNELPVKSVSNIESEESKVSKINHKCLVVDIETEEDILYFRSQKMILILEEPCKIKYSLQNVTIRKVGNRYDVLFSIMLVL